jgi:hypothetical protein
MRGILRALRYHLSQLKQIHRFILWSIVAINSILLISVVLAGAANQFWPWGVILQLLAIFLIFFPAHRFL